MENQEQVNQTEEAPTKMGALKSIGFGLLIFGVAYYFYSTMTTYENGEEVSMNVILFMAYNFLGKNISTGILALLGAFTTYSGIKEFMSAN